MSTVNILGQYSGGVVTLNNSFEFTASDSLSEGDVFLGTASNVVGIQAGVPLGSYGSIVQHVTVTPRNVFPFITCPNSGGNPFSVAYSAAADLFGTTTFTPLYANSVIQIDVCATAAVNDTVAFIIAYINQAAPPGLLVSELNLSLVGTLQAACVGSYVYTPGTITPFTINVCGFAGPAGTAQAGSIADYLVITETCQGVNPLSLYPYPSTCAGVSNAPSTLISIPVADGSSALVTGLVTVNDNSNVLSNSISFMCVAQRPSGGDVSLSPNQFITAVSGSSSLQFTSDIPTQSLVISVVGSIGSSYIAQATYNVVTS